MKDNKARECEEHIMGKKFVLHSTYEFHQTCTGQKQHPHTNMNQ